MLLANLQPTIYCEEILGHFEHMTTWCYKYNSMQCVLMLYRLWIVLHY